MVLLERVGLTFGRRGVPRAKKLILGGALYQHCIYIGSTEEAQRRWERAVAGRSAEFMGAIQLDFRPGSRYRARVGIEW